MNPAEKAYLDFLNNPKPWEFKPFTNAELIQLQKQCKSTQFNNKNGWQTGNDYVPYQWVLRLLNMLEKSKN
jgi:hypothetical protein